MRQHFTALAATLILAPASAMAQDAATPAPAAQNERVSMTRAIEAAQAQFDGGVLEAEIETEDGRLIYEIDMVRGSDVYELAVDAQTGDVLSQSEERLTSFLSGLFQEDELRAAGDSGDILMKALADLEATGVTQIEELSLDEEDGRMVYEIELTDASGEREILIDAATGETVVDAD
ncbi:PepSY domain-containing protein [Sulfitobacter sp. PS-8MA]|uniref:PepSY domain-containing protein n=1 Tax=Sulfitobacter sp. PS-8MA TaxID=3237707 RepID=UPI0034C5B7D1